MAIEQKYQDLINAAIDGEISAEEKTELQAFLADSAEGRALHGELSSLCDALNGVEEEAPPVHLRHVIMNSIPRPPTPASSPGFLQALISAPALRYALSFAAGEKRLGVPPPKKTACTRRPQTFGTLASRSATTART